MLFFKLKDVLICLISIYFFFFKFRFVVQLVQKATILRVGYAIFVIFLAPHVQDHQAANALLANSSLICLEILVFRHVQLELMLMKC